MRPKSICEVLPPGDSDRVFTSVVRPYKIKVHYVVDLSTRAARQNSRWQKNLKLRVM